MNTAAENISAAVFYMLALLAKFAGADTDDLFENATKTFNIGKPDFLRDFFYRIITPVQKNTRDLDAVTVERVVEGVTCQ